MDQSSSVNTSNRQALYPPKAKGFPILGPISALLREQFSYLERAHAELGDIYTLPLGTISMVVLNSPESAQHILVDHVKNYSKGGAINDSLRMFLGNGVFLSEGDFWLRQRRMMQPHFHRQRLEAVTDIMTSTIDEVLRTWIPYTQQPDPKDIRGEFAHLTMSIIARTMFGTDISEVEFAQISKKLIFILEYILPQSMTSFVPNWIPVPKRAEYQAALKDIRAIIERVIERRRQTLSNDLISILIEATDDSSGDHMTNQQLSDEALTIFAAGYESTALTLTWTMHFITQNPSILERLQQEVDSVLGQRTPMFEDLPKLPYCRQVFQETLRLYPTAYFLPRTAVEDDVINGFRIRAKQMVALSLYTVHRHPKYWESPNAFNPDRFSPEQSAGRHPLAWIPFGAGQRLCLGRDFAYMEGALIMAMLIQRFTVSAPANFVAKPKLSLGIYPQKGVLVHLKTR